MIAAVVLLVLIVGGVVAAVALSGDDDSDSDSDDSPSQTEESTSDGSTDEEEPGDESTAGGDEAEEDSGEVSEAEAIASVFVQALEDGDCPAAQATMVEPEECDRIMPPEDLGIEFSDDGEVAESGDTATVTFQAGPAGQTTMPFAVHVRNVDGEWKVVNAGREAQVPDSGDTSDSDTSESDTEDETEYLTGEDATEQFLDAVSDGDCEAAQDTMHDSATAECSEILALDVEGATWEEPGTYRQTDTEWFTRADLVDDDTGRTTSTYEFRLQGDDGLNFHMVSWKKLS